MYCHGCNYCLHKLPGNQCPECGHYFDANDPRTFSKSVLLFRRPIFVATLFSLLAFGATTLLSWINEIFWGDVAAGHALDDLGWPFVMWYQRETARGSMTYVPHIVMEGIILNLLCAITFGMVAMKMFFYMRRKLTDKFVSADKLPP